MTINEIDMGKVIILFLFIVWFAILFAMLEIDQMRNGRK